MSLSFDGLDDDCQLLNTLSVFDTGDITITAWINPSSSGEDGYGRIINIQKSDWSHCFWLALYDNALNYKLFAQRNGSGNGISVSSTGAGLFNAWNFVAAKWLSSDNKWYLYKGNASTAVSELSYSQQTACTTPNTGAGLIVLGNQAAGSSTFDGAISRVTLWSRALSINELDFLRLGFMPINDGYLQGYWPLDSQGLSIYDLSGNSRTLNRFGAVYIEDPPVTHPGRVMRFSASTEGTAPPVLVASQVSNDIQVSWS